MLHRTWDERCARCGDRLGIYERLACVHSDGSVVHDGLLRLRERLRGEPPAGVEVFHLDCAPASLRAL